MRSSRFFLFLATLLAGGLSGSGSLQAQPTAQEVKAAFLPKFARYVTWPPAAMPPANRQISLCIIGKDGLGPLLDRAVRGQSVDQHPLVVRRLASSDAAGSCQIAYVGGDGRMRAAALAHMRSLPVLTVTDGADGDTRGMINFVLKDGRVRFFIDEAAAASVSLVIDARLLGIALGVKQRAQ
jgi:YfiR/HmsC-like